jgi:hypothetical protein
VPSVTHHQEAYVRKVIDTVHDLDNVLYEISNEGEDSSREWQYHLIHYIHQYEASKPKQHPVGMTAVGSGDAESNRALVASPAEWISPHTDAWGGVHNVPEADGTKVSVLDSDHWFVVELYRNPSLGSEWVWKAFCRGHNPILMEHLPPQSMLLSECPLSVEDPGYVASRRAMGQTRRMAERINLAEMIPRSDLASSGCCLANPGKQYLMYAKGGVDFTVVVKAGLYEYEWHNLLVGQIAATGRIECRGGAQQFEPPFEADAALLLQRVITTQ